MVEGPPEGEATVVMPAPMLRAVVEGGRFDPAIDDAPMLADEDLETDSDVSLEPHAPVVAEPPPPPAAASSAPPLPPPPLPLPTSADAGLEPFDFEDRPLPDAEPHVPPAGEVERFSTETIVGAVGASVASRVAAEKPRLGDYESSPGATPVAKGSSPASDRAAEEPKASAAGDRVNPHADKATERRPEHPVAVTTRKPVPLPEPKGSAGGSTSVSRPAPRSAPGIPKPVSVPASEPTTLGGRISAGIDELKERLPEGVQDRLRSIIVGAGVALFLGIGLVLELATPYGFWFWRPVFGPSAAERDVPLLRLLGASAESIEADNYGAARKALELADAALASRPEDPRAQGRYAQAVYNLERNYGGQAPLVDRAGGYLDALVAKGSRDPAVVNALATRALSQKDAVRARALAEGLLSHEPTDREALALLAEALLDAKDKGATAQIQKLLVLAPKSPRALHLRGRALLPSDPDAAATSFVAALAADPRHSSSAIELAELALANHDREAAAGFVQQALGPEGLVGLGGTQLARAWAIQGTLEALARRPVEAERAFEAALQASGESLPARLAYGRFLVERRDFSKALELLRPAVASSPRDVDVAGTWALASLGVGKLAEAIQAVDALVAARPNDARALLLQGEIQLRTGKAKEAEKTFGNAAKKDPKLAPPRVALGSHYLAEGRLEEAKAEFDAALELAPAEPEVQTALGEWYLANGALDEALASFDAATAAARARATAYLGRARTLEAKGDLAGAIASCREAVAINDRIPEYRHLLGQLLWRQAEADGSIADGELDGALAELKEALDLDPKNVRHAAHLGAVQFRSGQVDQALKTLRGAADIDALEPEVRLWLSRAALEKGEFQDAFEAIRAAIRIDEKNAEYHYQHGLIFEANSNPVDAIDEFKRTVELSPGNADALEHLARNQAHMNAFSAALKNYEAALAIEPGRAKLLVAIGDVYLKAGQWDRAIPRFRQALQRDPTLVGAHALLGRAYDEKGQRTRAEAEYRISTQKDPTNAIAFRQLAYALKERGQKREAIAFFKKYLELEPKASDRVDVEDEMATLDAY